jgi:signal transduction histidine kinase
VVSQAVDAPLILVADDSLDNCELLSEQLRSLGYQAIVAHDAASALQSALEHHPDLAILDVQMPGAGLGVDDRVAGYEVCRQIRRHPDTARMPVVFITALADVGDRVQAIEAGGDDWLTKPHNRLLLGARVHALLRLRAATEALEGSYRRLRDVERARDELMQMIVHDLKTPLAAILATLELLGDGDLGPLEAQQSTAVQDAMRKSDELLELIDDLLEVRRMEEATITLDLAPVRLGELIHEVIGEAAARRDHSGATIGAEVSDDVPEIRGDRSLLKRVLTNLLQNALVHSRPNVQVVFRVCRAGSGAHVVVSDDGPGIGAELHELIFRKYGQGGAPRSARLRSSGLGLTFCRLIVEAHGGRIWVESAPGAGAEFKFDLPAVPPSTRMHLVDTP